MSKKLVALLMGIVAAAFFAAPAFAGDPGTGYIEVCKDTTAPTVSGPFAFSINGGSAITVNVGECSAPIQVASGTATVSEIDGLQLGGFYTYDFATVAGITASYPLGNALVSKNLVRDDTNRVAGSATVNVLPGDSSTATVVHFVNTLRQGYYEICKNQVSGAALDGQTFMFSVAGAQGYSASVPVTVGACSNPIYAPAGHLNVVEDSGGFTYVTAITAHSTSSFSDILNGNYGALDLLDLGQAFARISVEAAAPGFTSGETLLTYTNNSSSVKVCKIAGNEVLLGESYHFMVNGTAVSVTAGNAPGNCVIVPVRYHANTPITVTELPTPGEAPSWFTLSPVEVTVSHTSGELADFTGNSVTFNAQAGENIVTFANDLQDPGQLKICQNGGPASASYTITGPRRTLGGPITQGTDTLSVLAGQCTLSPTWYPYDGVQTITQTAPGFGASSITVSNADRLDGTPNLAAGTVSVFIGLGVTTVTYTDAAAAAAAPAAPAAPVAASGSGSGSDPSGPAAPAAAAAAASSTATTASASTPKAAKIVKAASVSMARIVTLKSGRYVNVRVNSANAKATIRLTLIGRNGKVLRTVLRSVNTNHVVRVANLKLGPSVRSIRVTVT